MSLTPAELLVHEPSFERSKTLGSEIHEFTDSIERVGVMITLYISIRAIQ
jgi:hypothetical protein